MRDTPPCRTLLTYFVPSAVITTPSLPACTARSVCSSSPSGENVSTASSPMLTTTTLPSPSIATPFGAASGAPCTSALVRPSGVMRKSTSGLRVFVTKIVPSSATAIPLRIVAPSIQY